MSSSPSPVSERDRHNFRRLKRDLWHDQGSRVSLMVGAGVSMNARPLPGVATAFPTWEKLAKHMWKDLYHRPENAPRTKTSKRGGRPSPERIASEYEAVFHRKGLEDLIRKFVPDNDYEPGELHEKLLRLPWRDVFTTNYDTLLENTSVRDRSYHPVTSVTELTRANPPRIIKLHGSFGVNSPLISTEEDYRTYPRRFAPFVNTVRQTLIENALVLVGFSGDDRNFLEWTGWIRDELGTHHCPLYLVVAQPLDDIQRRLLNERGVTPIVIVPDVAPNTSGMTKSGAALLHFVRALERKKRRPEKWTIDTRSTAVNGPSSRKDTDLNTKIEGAIRRWRRDRDSYPGWLIAPAGDRQALWLGTREWVEPLLEGTASWSVTDRIIALSELNWRLEVALVPLFSEWREKMDAAASRFAEEGLSSRDERPAKERLKTGARSAWSAEEAWVRVMLALVREARETHDATRWDDYMGSLKGVIDRHSRLVDRYRYERVLWALAQIDRRQARTLLAEWEPAPGALRASLWRAGLLAEVGQPKEARATLRAVLEETRRATWRADGRSVELLSVEGWCTYLLFAVELSLDFGNYEALREEFVGRWRELRAVECDPWGVEEYFSRVMERKPPTQPRNVRSWSAFDPGRRHVVRSLDGGGIGPWLPAFAYLRWLEEVGAPARSGGLSAAPSGLVAACRWVAPFFSFRSISVLVRAGAAKELREREFIDRPRVAEMELEAVAKLKAVMSTAVDREAEILAREARPWIEASVLEAAVEVLSRTTVRLEQSDLKSAVQTPLALYRNWRSVSIPGLAGGVRSWFERIYEAADGAVLAGLLPVLLDAPLWEGGDDGGAGFWRDPLGGFPLYRIGDRGVMEKERLEAIQGAATRLLLRGEGETGRRRENVVWRLSVPFRMGLLTGAQRRRFAALLWAEVEDGTLPQWKGLWVWDYAALPSMGRGDLPERIKADLLRRFPAGEVKAEGAVTSMVIRNRDDRPWEAGAATKGVVEMPYEPKGIVEWTAEERNRLWSGLRAWWEEHRMKMVIEERVPLFGEGDRTRDQAADLERCLVRLKIATMASGDATAWVEVIDFVEETRKQGVELGGALPYLLIGRPREKQSVAERLTEDLRCENARRAMAAARGVRHWIYLAEAGRIPKAPSAVVEALVDRVAFRLLAGAEDCIRTLAAVLVENGNVVSSGAVQRLVNSLNAWRKAVELVGPGHEPEGVPQADRPDLRASLGVLVNALKAWWAKNRVGRKPPEAVQRLLADYQADPLPEVRWAVSEDRWRYW